MTAYRKLFDYLYEEAVNHPGKETTRNLFRFLNILNEGGNLNASLPENFRDITNPIELNLEEVNLNDEEYAFLDEIFEAEEDPDKGDLTNNALEDIASLAKDCGCYPSKEAFLKEAGPMSLEETFEKADALFDLANSKEVPADKKGIIEKCYAQDKLTKMFSYISKGITKEIGWSSYLSKILPEEDDKTVKRNVIRNFSYIADKLHDEHLKTIVNNPETEDSLIAVLSRCKSYIDKSPNKKVIEDALSEYMISITKSVFGKLQTKENLKAMEAKLAAIPQVKNNLPKSDILVTPYENHALGESHPYHDEITDIIKNLDKNDPMRDIYKEADRILVDENESSTQQSLNVDNQLDQASDTRRVERISAISKTEYKDMLTYDRRTINRKEDVKLKDFIPNVLSKEKPMPEAYRNEIKSIIREMQDAGIFRPEDYTSEADVKIYGFTALIRAKKEVEKAYKEKNEAGLEKAVGDYKRLEESYDHIISRLHAINPSDDAVTNISTGRNGKVPAKYRLDRTGNARLSGLWMAIGFCQKYGISTDDFIDRPVEVISNIIKREAENAPIKQFFKDNQEHPENILKLFSDNRSIVEITKKTNELSDSIDRAGSGISVMSGDAQAEMNIMMITSASTAALADLNTKLMSGYFRSTPDSRTKPEETIANILLYKKEDLDPFKVNGKFSRMYDPATGNTFPYTQNLGAYIQHHYTYMEMKDRLSYIHSMPKEGISEEIKQSLTKALTIIEDEIKICYSAYPMERDSLLNVLTKGEDPISELASYSAENKMLPENVNANFADFYKKVSKVAAESLGILPQEEVLQDKVDNYISHKSASFRLDFYVNEFKDLLKKQHFDLKTLGFTDDRNGVLEALNAVAEGDARFANLQVEERFFDSLKDHELDGIKLNNVLVPDEYRNQNPQKAMLIEAAFPGVKEANNFCMAAEKIVTDPSEKLHGADAMNEYLKDHREMAENVEFLENTVLYSPYKNREQGAKDHDLLSQFELSDNTKKGILAVYSKMKEYGMMRDFPQGGEEGTKIYGFHRYFEEMQRIQGAVEDKDYDMAARLAGGYQKLHDEYNEVMDLCENVFPQDGLHCSSNLLCSRQSYLPYEFASRIQPQIQMNAVYMIASMCDRYQLNFEHVIQNPADAIKEICKIRDREFHEKYGYDEKNPGKALATLVSEKRNDTDLMTTIRGMEALFSLESDDELGKKDSVIAAVFQGFRPSAQIMVEPFAKKEGQDMVSPADHKGADVDYEMIRRYFAGIKTHDITDFLPGQILASTGKKSDFHKSSTELIREDERTLSEALKDTLSILSGAVMEINRLYAAKDYDPVSGTAKLADLYAGAASYIKEFISVKGLDRSMDVILAEGFIKAPSRAVKQHIMENHPKLHKIILQDSKAYETTEAMGLQADSRLNDFYNEHHGNTSDALKAAYDALLAEENGRINENNIGRLLVLSRCAMEKYNQRSALRNAFSFDAGKENKIEEAVHQAALKIGVPEGMYQDIVYNYRHPGALAELASSMAYYNEHAKPLLDTRLIETKLAGIFEKGTADDLTENQKEAILKNAPFTEDDIHLRKEALAILRGNLLNEDNLKASFNILREIHSVNVMVNLTKEQEASLNHSRDLVLSDLKNKGLSSQNIHDLLHNKMSMEAAVEAANHAIMNEMTGETAMMEYTPEQVQIMMDNIFCKGSRYDLTDYQIKVLDYPAEYNDPEELAIIGHILSGNNLTTINLEKSIDLLKITEDIEKNIEMKQEIRDAMHQSSVVIRSELTSRGLTDVDVDKILKNELTYKAALDKVNGIEEKPVEKEPKRQQIDIDLEEDQKENQNKVNDEIILNNVKAFGNVSVIEDGEILEEEDYEEDFLKDVENPEGFLDNLNKMKDNDDSIEKSLDEIENENPMK